MKIMLVEDEEDIRIGVSYIIKKMGHEVCVAEDGNKALEIFKSEAPDLAILDIMIPGINGFDVCKAIRETSNMPVLILSAKGDIVDKTIGFKAGADDYLVKPFVAAELELRINSFIRHLEYESTKEEHQTISVLEICDMRIDLDNHLINLRGEELDLTPKEFEIISFLATHAGQSFTREQLLDKIWGSDYVGDSNIVTVFMRKIREKIELNPAKPEYLLTVWGYGYKFVHKK